MVRLARRNSSPPSGSLWLTPEQFACESAVSTLRCYTDKLKVDLATGSTNIAITKGFSERIDMENKKHEKELLLHMLFGTMIFFVLAMADVGPDLAVQWATSIGT